MKTFLIIAAIIAAVYLYGGIAFYYGFKNWYPLCGCGKKCEAKRVNKKQG